MFVGFGLILLLFIYVPVYDLPLEAIWQENVCLIVFYPQYMVEKRSHLILLLYRYLIKMFLNE
jgi:hypothetical protein